MSFSDVEKLQLDPDCLELLLIGQNIRPCTQEHYFPRSEPILYSPIGLDLKLAGRFFIARVTKFR